MIIYAAMYEGALWEKWNISRKEINQFLKFAYKNISNVELSFKGAIFIPHNNTIYDFTLLSLNQSQWLRNYPPMDKLMLDKHFL